MYVVDAFGLDDPHAPATAAINKTIRRIAALLQGREKGAPRFGNRRFDYLRVVTVLILSAQVTLTNTATKR